MASLKRIALAIPPGWEYFHLLTEGILQYQAERGGYSVRDFRFDEEPFVKPDQPPTWDGWEPVGVLCAVGKEPGLDQWLLSGRLPIVNMTPDVDPKLMPSVHATSAGKLAVRHLISLGIQHIAHVGLADWLGAERRFDNIAAQLHKLGLKPLRYDFNNDPVGASAARLRKAASEPELQKFLKTTPKPLGIVAMNDDFARCICLACESLKLQIPHDVAVVGVDDSSVSRFNDPPITSVRTPGRKVGFAAMKLLEELLQGKTPPRTPLEIECEEIMVRQSTQVLRDDSIERAMRLIENEGARGLTVGDLARQLAISRSFLEKKFVDEFGVTPAQQIKAIRLNRAKELLSQTELSITRIAAMLGYSRNSAFASFFRGCEGVNPGAFRQRSQGPRRAPSNGSRRPKKCVGLSRGLSLRFTRDPS